MALPQKIKNMLALGENVAAEVPATRLESRAWVYVQPVLEGKPYRRVLDKWTRDRNWNSPYEVMITRYEVRHIELGIQYLDWGYEIDIAVDQYAITHDSQSIITEDDLEAWLTARLQDLSSLRLPSSVEFPGR